MAFSPDAAAAARSDRLAGAAILALAVLAYLPALGCGWIWDDNANVTQCRAVQTWGGILEIWGNPRLIQQYYPLTHTTFWIEHKLWGLHPAGYHAVNVLLHALNAWLLRKAFRRLGLPVAAAWIGAALFAVHPVHVESVAWVTERKNTLSMAFYLGSGLLWLRWAGLAADREGEGERRPWAGHLLLFLAAVLSKSVTTTLPALLLVVAWWKRGRVAKRDVLSLLPAFAVAVASGVMTSHLEKSNVGAEGFDWSYTPAERILVAGRAPWFYALKLLLPVDLVMIYPQWKPNASSWDQWLFPLGAVGLPALLLLLRGRIGRGPAAAALAFGGTLFPVLGFFDVYYFRFTFVADHFQYHACAGPLALAGVGLARAASALDRLRAGAGRAAPAAGLLLLGSLAVAHVGTFRDRLTLWSETVRRNPGAWIAWNHLGGEALERGLMDEAERMLRKSISIKRHNYEAWNNLGACLADRGRPDEAVEAFRHFADEFPRESVAQENLARALLYQGNLPRAVEVFRLAVSLPGRRPGACVGLVEALHRAGRTEEAEEACREARGRYPGDARFSVLLGRLLLRRGRAVEAVEVLDEAAAGTGRRDPRVLDDLARALAAAGRFEFAVQAAEEALALGPGPETAATLRGHLEKFRRGEAVGE